MIKNFNFSKFKTHRLHLLFGFLGISLIIAVLIDSGQKNNVSTNDKASSADTYIPPGYVLIPIDIQNSQSLDQILGRTGVVDLYATRADRADGPAQLVVKAIKIIRSPLNSEIYAVLAPEDDAKRILQFPGPFVVAIQNPGTNGTNFVKQRAKTQRTITVEMGNDP